MDFACFEVFLAMDYIILSDSWLGFLYLYKTLVIVQAVLKHLGHVNADAVVVDEEELRCHQKLQDLYSSTKAAKVRTLRSF